MKADDILEQRIKKFKNTTNKFDLLKKTENNLLSLRKNQIDDYIMSKRKVVIDERAIYQINPLMCFIPQEMMIDIPLFLNKFDIKILENYLYNTETHIMKYGLYILRKYLATEDTVVNMKEIVDDGSLINYLASLLVFPDNTVKFEVSWILINISNYSDQAMNYLSTEKNLDYLLDFFRYADEYLNEHAIWLLGNLAADSQFNREYLMKNNIIDKLTQLLEEFGTTDSTKEKIIWCLCNLCRGRVIVHANLFLEILPGLVKYLNNATIEKEINQCLFCIFKLTSTSSLILDKFINLNVYDKISDILYKYDKSVKYYCVRILANLVSGNDVQTQLLINRGIIDLYRNLLEEDEARLIKEVLWGISNICAGTVSQIEKILNQGLMLKIFEICENLIHQVFEDKIYYETLREGLFAICNAVTGTLVMFRAQMLQNNKCDLLLLLTDSLKIFSKEKRLIEVILLSLQAFLNLDDEDPEDQIMLNMEYSVKNSLLKYGLESTLHELWEGTSGRIADLATELLDNLEM